MYKLPLEITASTFLGEVFPRLIREMSSIETSHFAVYSPRLPKGFDGLKIAHLSDLHNKLYGSRDINLARRIFAENPDIVVMTGDMVSHGAPNTEDFLEFVRIICRKFPVYYVNGNHERSDLDEKRFGGLADEMKKAGAVCIDNAFVELHRGGDTLRLAGLCYSARFYRGVRQYKSNWSRFTAEDMRRYAGKKPEGIFTLLLAHNPLDFEVYADWGADVTFSGHVHGGSVRLPLVGGILSPERKLFPKYKEGIYRKGRSFMVVSRGLGRIRFANPPELVMVRLRKERT